MACEDHLVFVDKEGIGEAKLPDTVGNLSDLLLGVGPGIAWVRVQDPGGEVGDL